MPKHRRSFSLQLDHRRARLTLLDRKAARYELEVDGIPQSVVSVNDPTTLEYPYIRHIARALDAAAPTGGPLFTVHLGAGALTLPRYVEATRPGSPQLVVEFEPALFEAVVTALPLAEGNDVRVVFGDARAVADAPLPATTDAGPGAGDGQVPGVGAAADAGTGAGVGQAAGDGQAASLSPERPPAAAGVPVADDTSWVGAEFTVVDLWDAAVIHQRVATLEFYRRVAARAAEGGVVAVNLLDGHPFDYSRRQAVTLAAVFAHVAVVLDAGPDDDEGPLGNVLVFASDEPLELVARPDLLSTPQPHVLHGATLEAWTADAALMTDADGTDSPDPDDPRWD
ncbi:polyamine aminopropyltransferase [Herbiconiux daphne]|uniref:Spermine synthase n=1 Tax=Herbiconiux daphne TaxID=2970914 RepID=A0ABT2H056_9MICO|nr:hypothetical protein [Herbiconiux daphne]MCS5732985.1 hypothetical protein [Herbiconiux daphne]